MANKHGVVNLDKLQATKSGNIESVVSTVDLDNGSVVAIGGLAGMGGEVVTAAAPTDVATQEVLLVASVEELYDERDQIYDFSNPAGFRARAYHLYVGDIVSVSNDMIDGDAVVGQYLIPENGKTKLVPVATLEVGENETPPRFAAQVIAKEKALGVDCTVYRVLRS